MEFRNFQDRSENWKRDWKETKKGRHVEFEEERSMQIERRRTLEEIETIEATQQEAHSHESLLARIDNGQTKQFRNPAAPEYLFLAPIHALFALVSIL